jgi:hypothetical protein
MQREGPPLEALTRRLAETPEDLLAEPVIGGAGRVHTAAVVNDLLDLLDGGGAPPDLAPFASRDSKRDRNRLAITLVLCWLLADEWFRGGRLPRADALRLLAEEPAALAPHVASAKLVTDPERREELARVALARLGYRPAGETVAQAQDRLTGLSSTERERVLRASRMAEERARQVREALARKAAEESADKWTRE